MCSVSQSVVMMRAGLWLGIALLCAVAPPLSAHLYTREDLVVSLADGNHPLLLNSSSAWLAQFFAHWCGHCQYFKDSWVQLARDLRDWRPAFYMGVLDCANEENTEVCKEFQIEGYPTIKFFHAQAKKPSDGIKSWNRDVGELKKFIIDNLESKKESPPPACPPLEPISTAEVEQFFENNNEDYLVLIFEPSDSYMAREVELDMVQYDGASVRRVLSTQEDLVAKYNVSSFPSGVLLNRDGSVSNIKLAEESRAEYTNFVRSLPGVKKLSLNIIGWSGAEEAVVPRRPASSSKIYMADLESSIHYSLRVEAARYSTLEGDRLKALYQYVTVLKEYFPARPYLRNLLNNLYDWLSERQGQIVTYESFADVVNNKDQKSNAVLSRKENYAWCQGSQPAFRGFPCTVWTLYHLLTVQANEMKTSGSNPLQVLQAMREYVRYFFGCRPCAEEFEKMASITMSTVENHEEAIEWLWRSHNRVNQRLAGNGKQDPEFPKMQWPPKELCPKCRRKVKNMETWNLAAVLRFLKHRFSKDVISSEYLEDEEELLKKQREDAGSNHEEDTPKKQREDAGSNHEEDPLKKQREDAGSNHEEDLLKKQREDVGSNDEGVKTESVEKEQEPPSLPTAAPNKSGEEKENKSKGKINPRHRPMIIKMKPNSKDSQGLEGETILDLDAYENRYFRGRTLQDSGSRLHKRALHPKVLMDPDSEIDENAVRERLIKRGLNDQFLSGVVVEDGNVNWKGRWVKMLESGFSRLDISLCIILYFLTSMCLLIMYLYLSLRRRYLRQWCGGHQA